MLLYLPYTPHFVLASAELVSVRQVTQVTLSQLVPELMVDVYSTAVEVQGAMLQAYEDYLKRDSMLMLAFRMWASVAIACFIAVCCLRA